MARPQEHDKGMISTSVYIPYDIHEQAKKEGINLSETLTNALIVILKHPGFKKEKNRKEKVNDLLKPVPLHRLKKIRKFVKTTPNISTWVQVLERDFNVKISEEDLQAWAFDKWD